MVVSQVFYKVILNCHQRAFQNHSIIAPNTNIFAVDFICIFLFSNFFEIIANIFRVSFLYF